MRTALVGLLFLLTACSEGAGWVGEDPHIVDRSWVLSEQRCDRLVGASCTVAVDAAIAGTGIAPATIVAAWTASWPTSYRDGRGGTILGTYAGLSQPSAVIFDFGDGTRRLVSVLCGGPVTTGDGVPVSPRTCELIDPPEGKRVGHEPWLDGS